MISQASKPLVDICTTDMQSIKLAQNVRLCSVQQHYLSTLGDFTYKHIIFFQTHKTKAGTMSFLGETMATKKSLNIFSY
jgi:hypothetical protein